MPLAVGDGRDLPVVDLPGAGLRRRWLVALAAVPTAMFLAGCATTGQGCAGAPLPSDKIAVLRTWAIAKTMTYNVNVFAAVDGIVTKTKCVDLELLPGPHRVVPGWSVLSPLLTAPLVGKEGWRFEPGVLSLDADAGERYRLMVGEESTKHQLAWIENSQGMVVAGCNPHTDMAAPAAAPR